MVLLHGLASQRRFWNLVVPYLAGLPVVAIDQRGHGDSEQPESGYDFDTIASDVVTALDALGWSRAVVVGHSWGAGVALCIAAMHPERTLATVAIDGGVSTPSRRWTRDEAREALSPPRFAVPPEELVARIRDGWLAGFWSPEAEEAILPIFGVGADGLARARLTFAHHMQVVDALYDYDPDAVLTNVRCPAWIAIAEPVTATEPSEAGWATDKAAGIERAAALLALPRLIRLGGAVHDVPLQWPGLVAGVIRAAVDEVARGATAEGRT